MSGADWERIKRAFDGALGLDRDARGPFIAEACGGDETLAREVRSLLEAHDRSTGFLDTPADMDGGAEAADSLCGRLIGPYRVLALIGSGGMGIVYRAVRDDDAFRKEVALKVVRAGVIPDLWTDRLRQERRILATVEHPNVARLLDGGTTEDGRPYFVMELVDGEPIDTYCRREGLSVTARIKLLEQVCVTVQYLHQNLIVHRDLKPANILVTRDGTPKLLDFGIAKLLQPSEEGAEAARTELAALTPYYASPEQMKGDPITTASDVYSLGVLLFELLAERRPFSLAGLAPAEVLRVVCETPASPPSSAVLGDGGGDLGAEPQHEDNAPSRRAQERLARSLAGDLDAIAMMALRKEPQRRYGSALELAEDLGRYLEGLPIKARPETLRYRACKFVARHRVPVVAGGVVALTLVAGMATTVREWRRAESERVRAAHQAERAAAVTQFLKETLGQASPYGGAGGNPTVGQVLETARTRLDQSFSDSPDIQAAVRAAIGEAYAGLGRYAEAEPLLRTALEAQRERLDGDSLEVAETMRALGALLRDKGQLDEAKGLIEGALRVQDAPSPRDPPALARSLSDMGALSWAQGDVASAGRFFRRGVEVMEGLPSPSPHGLASLLGNLAVAMEATDREEAQRLYRRTLEMLRSIDRRQSPGYSGAASNLGLLLKDEGQYDQAEPLLREALAIDRVLFGARHPNVGVSLNNLACLLRDAGDPAAAASLFVEAIGILEGSLGAEHWMVGRCRGALGVCLLRAGRSREAERELLAAEGILVKSVGAGDERTVVVRSSLAELYESRGKKAVAQMPSSGAKAD